MPHPTEQQLREAITFVSEIIIEHGAKYAPLLDRLEQELDKLRHADPLARARRHVDAARLRGN